MNYLRLISISKILLVLLLFGCRDNSRDRKADNDTFISIPVNVDNAGSLLYSDIFEKPQFVPLETTMYSLFGTIAQVHLTDSLIILNDWDHRVLIFNREGKFISSIYNRGRGPGEYMYLHYVDVDEERGHLWFFESQQGYFICMDHQGNFFERIRIDNAYGYPMFKNPFTDQLLLDLASGAAFDPNNTRDQTHYHILSYNRESGKTDLWLPMPHNYRIMMRSGFSVFGEKVYYKPIVWDTIYQVMEDGVTPAYVFDFGKHSKPAEIYTAKDVETFNVISRKYSGYAFAHYGFKETTSSIISIHSVAGSGRIMNIFNKKNSESHAYSSYRNDFLGQMKPVSFDNFGLINEHKSNPDILVTAYSVNYILRNDKELRERISQADYRRFMAANPSYAKMIREIKESDNHVIAIYPIK